MSRFKKSSVPRVAAATVNQLESRLMYSSTLPPASDLVPSGPPSPTTTVTDSHGRAYSLYTRPETDVKNGAPFVVVSYIHSGQTTWTRRIVAPGDVSEFFSPPAVQRSFFSSVVNTVTGVFKGVFQTVEDVVNAASKALKPLFADGSKLLQDVLQLVRDGGTFLNDLVAAEQQIGSAAGLKAYLTTALSEQTANMSLAQKMSNAISAACSADPNAAPMLALAIDQLPQ
jgi:hypothetical protein